MFPFGEGPVVEGHQRCPTVRHQQQTNRGREAIYLRPLPRTRIVWLTYGLECPQGRLPAYVGVHDPPGGLVHRHKGPPFFPPHPFT